MKKIIVEKKYNNRKVSNLILDSYPNLNKNTLYKAFRKKDIRVNNIKISQDTIVRENDEVSIYITDKLLLRKN